MKIVERIGWNVLAILCLLAGVTLTARAEMAEWERFPRLGIPRLPASPDIDGEVDPREWIGAAQLQPLVRTDDGLQHEEHTEVYMGYTDEALYISWRIERPPVPMLVATEEPKWSRGVFRDESIELFIDLEGQGETAIQFGGNPAGAFADAWVVRDGTRGRRDFEREWDWTYRARTITSGWEGELRLPFASLEMDGPPAPGTEWGFDFMRADKTPDDRYSTLSFRPRGELADFTRMSRLMFLEDAAAFRLQTVGSVGDTSAGLLAALVNTSEKPFTAQVEYGVYTLKPGQTAGNIFESIDSGLGGEDGMTGDVAAFTTVERQIQDLLSLYDLHTHEQKEVVVEPDERAGLTLLASDVPTGELVVAWKVRSGTGEFLSAGMLPATRHSPIHVDYTPYFLTSDVLQVSVSLHTSRLQTDTENLILRLEQDGELRAEKRVDPDTASDEVLLSTADIGEGAYNLLIRALDEMDNKISERSLQLQRPIPDWVANAYGVSSFVPPPYEPVDAEADRVRVWGREYRWGDTVFPAQITSAGEAIFSGTPRLIVRRDGQDHPARGRLTLAESDPEAAVYRFKGEAGRIPLEADISVEFDGFMTIDLMIDGGDETVDALWAEFPVAAGQAELYTFNAYYDERTHRPDTREMLELSGGMPRAGRVPDDGFHIGFNHAVWLGNPERGFQWCTETARDWTFDDRSRSIELQPSADGTALFRLRVIDRPVEMGRRTYRWGLAASPVREYGRGGQDFYYGQGGNWKYDRRIREGARMERTNRYLDAYEELGGEWYNVFSDWNSDFAFGQPFREIDSVEERRAFQEFINSRGFRTTWYSGWNALDPRMEMYPYYGEAMRRTPTRFSYGGYKECTRAGYVEYLSAGAVWMIENIGIDGIYLDSTPGPEFCDNPLHGCGFTDPDTGHRVVTRDIWGRRELFKRLYKIFHGEVLSDGIIYAHDGWPPILGVLSFMDIFHTGEGAREEDYHELDFYLAQYNPTQYGVPVEHAWRSGHVVERNHAWGVSLLHGNRIKMYPYHASNPNLQRDHYGDELGICFRMWAPSRWFDWESDWSWHPYYANQDVVQIDSADVKASFHRNERGQVIFNAFNQGLDQKSTDFTLDLDQLDLPGELHARDAVTGETFKVHEGRFTLDILGLRPRVLVLAPDPIPEL